MADSRPPQEALPVGSAGRHAGGWWGVMVLIVTEGALFGYLFFTYFYLASQTLEAWPPEGTPDLRMPGINTLILLTSSVCVWASERSLRAGRLAGSTLAMAAAAILGIGFVLIQLGEWRGKAYGIQSHVYGSLYFTITGFHLAHVVVGLALLLLLLVWIALGYFDRRRHAAITVGGWYWHFVDAVWLGVFSILYLWPYFFGAAR